MERIPLDRTCMCRFTACDGGCSLLAFSESESIKRLVGWRPFGAVQASIEHSEIMAYDWLASVGGWELAGIQSRRTAGVLTAFGC